MSKALIVQKIVKFPTDTETLWTALTDPQYTRQYMYGCELISDWIPGHDIIWKGASDGMVYVKGKILEYREGEKLRFSTAAPDKDIPENPVTVTYELIPHKDYVMLTITQGDYANMENGKEHYQNSLEGWDEVIEDLKGLFVEEDEEAGDEGI